jgi:hypothetical protein
MSILPRLQQQPLPLAPTNLEKEHKQDILMLQRLSEALLIYLLGPVVFIARRRWHRAAGPLWQAKERWERINSSALHSLFWYVPVLFFHTPLAVFWSTIFVTLARWTHIPLLAQLGGTSLFPPLPDTLLLRWLLALPLGDLLAICFETIKPKTTWYTERILTPDEKLAQTMQGKKALPTPASSLEKTTTWYATPETPSRGKTGQQDHASSWSSISWQQIPNTDPIKQETMQGVDQQRMGPEEARDRWLAQQRIAQPTIVEATLATHLRQTAPTPPSSNYDGYDWNDGEGRAQQ